MSSVFSGDVKALDLNSDGIRKYVGAVLSMAGELDLLGDGCYIFSTYPCAETLLGWESEGSEGR